MRVWASILYSRQTTRLSQGFRTPPGHVEATRWEWGLGKGQWKRAARKLDPGVQVSARYFIIGSRYKLTYSGTQAAANLVYEEVR